MSRYAVKIGEIVLKSEKPITLEEQERAVRLLRSRKDGPIAYVDRVEVALVVTVGG